MALSLALAVVFAWAGVVKIVAPDRWRKDLLAYRLSRPFRAAGLLLVPWLEVSIAVAVLAGHMRLGGALALALLASFSVAIVRARVLAGSNQLACGCFGGHATRDYRILLARNGALILLTAAVIALPVRPLLPEPQRGAPVTLLAVALILLGAIWVVWQLRTRARPRQAGEPAGSG